VVPRIEQVYKHVLEAQRVNKQIKGYEDEQEYLGVGGRNA
jgi:hypothetical protein